MEIKCAYDELVPVEKLVPHPRNNNKHPEEQLERLTKIIKYSGFRHPITVSKRSGFIVVGHGRLDVARRLGMEEVPVDYQDFESEAAEYQHLTADNEIARWAEFDLDQTRLDLKELEFDLDLDLLGLRDLDLDVELLEPQSDEDAVPEIPEEPVTKLGDVWLLGDHRVMCGDSTLIDSVEKLMDGQKADLVFTDPPYNQNTQRGGGGDLGKSLRAQSDKIEHLCDFDPKGFLGVLPVVFNRGINAYIFCNKDLLPDYLAWAKDFGCSFWVLVWKKPGGIPINSAHRPDIEYMVVCRKKSIFNSGLSSVNYSRVMEYGRSKEGLHPTMKPVEMITNQLLIGSNKNSVICDFFLGSGSTLIACEKTNRKCYGMELDPQYCDVIIKRWQDYTGKQAMLESSGETYKDLTNDNG